MHDLESEHLQDYETAKNYFQDAIAINMDAVMQYILIICRNLIVE